MEAAAKPPALLPRRPRGTLPEVVGEVASRPRGRLHSHFWPVWAFIRRACLGPHSLDCAGMTHVARNASPAPALCGPPKAKHSAGSLAGTKARESRAITLLLRGKTGSVIAFLDRDRVSEEGRPRIRIKAGRPTCVELLVLAIE